MSRRTLSAVVAIAILTFVAPHRASAQSASDDASRRGDIAVGYGFGYGTNGTPLPFGLVISEAWRVHSKLDLFADSGFQHGSIPLAYPVTLPGTGATISSGLSVLGLMGGARASFGTRYGERTTEFLQVKFGLVRSSASAVTSSNVTGASSPSWAGSALAIEPGAGFEVGLGQQFAIRPQVGVRFTHSANGSWVGYSNVAISAVFKVRKQK